MQMTAKSRERISYRDYPVRGVEAMAASTAREFPRHSHDQYGIGVIDSGGHSSWSGRGQVEIGAGGLICCNPGEVTDGRGAGGNSRSWRMLYFEPDVFQELWAEDGEFEFVTPVFVDHVVRQSFNEAFRVSSFGDGAQDAIACECALVSLVGGLQPHSTSRQHRLTGATPSVQRATEKIADNPAAAVTLGELAADTGLSRFQLLRAFVSEVGLTPHAYIIQQRIQLARRLMNGSRPLSEVALLAGFCDQSHMTRWFVRCFGITPSRYASRQ